MPYSSRLTEIYIHSVDVAFAVVDAHDIIRMVNDTLSGLLNRNHNELVGESYSLMLPKNEDGSELISGLIRGEEDKLKITKVWWNTPDSFVYLKGYARDEDVDEYGHCRLIFLRDVSEEVLYREQLDFQASVLQNVQDSVFVTDEQGIITYWNDAAAALFGLNTRDTLRQHVSILDVELDLESFLENARKIPNYTENKEWVYLRNDSEVLYAIVKLSPLYRSGEVRGLIAVAKDFTGNKEQEKALYRQQQELTSIIDSQTNYLIRTDLEARFTYANSAFVDRFHQFEDIIGLFSMDTIIPEDHEKTYKMVEECLEHPGKMVPIEIRKPAPDGGYYTNYWEFVAITDEQGKPTEIQGVGYEITEKKKQEKELYRKQQELASVIDSQTNYLIRTDLEGKYTFANPAFLKKFSHYGDIIGMPYFPTIHPDDVEKAQKMAEECLTHPGKMVPIEIRKPKPDKNSYYTNYWEFVAITDEQGNPTEIQGVGYDITERKENEERVSELSGLNHLLLQISTDFINISYQDLQQQIPRALEMVTKFTGFERSFIYLFDEQKDLGYLSYEYCAPGITPSGPEEKVYPAEPFPWWMGKILAGETIQLRKLEDLPDEADNEYQLLNSNGIKSVAAVPIIYQDDFLGYIGFLTLSKHKSCPDEIIELLQLLGAILANALYRVRTERKLITSNQQYRMLADNITDMVSRHNTRLRTLFVSPSCSDMLGYQPSDLLGRDMKELIHPGDLEIVQRALGESKKESKGKFQARMQHRSSEYKWIESYFSTVEMNDSLELILVTRDIDEQKHIEIEKDQLLQETQALNEELNASEEELRQNLEYTHELNNKLLASEKHFKGLIEKSFDAILVYDKDGFVKYASPSALRISGYPEMVGMHGTQFVLEEDLPEAEQIATQVMNMPGEHIGFEQRIRRADGRVIWIEAVMTNQLEDDAIGGLISNFRDITERKEAALALEENRTSLNIAQRVSKVGSWEVELESGKASWSMEFYHIFSLDPEGANPENTDIFSMIHPEDRDMVREKTDEAFRELKEIPVSYRIVDTRGRLKYLDAQSKIIRDTQGKPVKMLGVVRDVTRETKLEYLLDETSRLAKLGGWEFDIYENQLTWTEETYRIHEITSEIEVSVEKAFSFYHSKDAPVLKEAFRQLMDEGKSYELELKILTAKGNRKWVRVSGGAYDVKDNKISRVRGTMQDITERKRREEMMRQYSERLSLAVKTARIGIWELDLDTNQLSWNDQQLEIYGISRQQFEKDYEYWKTLVHPDDRASADAEIGKVIEGESVYDVEFRIIRPDGELRYINASAQPIFNLQKEVVSLIGVNLDVSGIKKGEKEIRNYSRRLQLATASAQIGVWDLDINSGKLIWDQRTHEQYGISPESFDGSFESWRDRIHPDDIEGVSQKFNVALENRDEYDADFRIIRADNGETRYIQAHATIVEDNNTGHLNMIGVSWDITEQKENELRILQKNKDLEKANAELDHFVYSTSHNLRAPLTSVLGIVQVLSEVETEEERQKFVGMIGKSIQKLDETIQEISDYSKNTRIELKKDPVDFPEIIGAIQESLSFMESADSIRYTVDIPENLEFHSDTNRLRIIFNNLISNAVKYMNPAAEQPFIKIAISQQEQGVHILLEDNGIGIKQEYINRIFDMFFRATNKASGSGLGLYIVKEAVNKLGGEISIDSKPNEGTRFDIYLPDL